MAKFRRKQVFERAKYACEYCRMPQAFSVLPHEVDHIRAKNITGLTRWRTRALLAPAAMPLKAPMRPATIPKGAISCGCSIRGRILGRSFLLARGSAGRHYVDWAGHNRCVAHE